MSELVQKIKALHDDGIEDCFNALRTLRALLPILFHLLPLTTVERAIMNEIELRLKK